MTCSMRVVVGVVDRRGRFPWRYTVALIAVVMM